MNVEALFADLNRRGIRLIPSPPKLAVEPASKLNDHYSLFRRRAARIAEFEVGGDVRKTIRLLCPQGAPLTHQPKRVSGRGGAVYQG